MRNMSDASESEWVRSMSVRMSELELNVKHANERIESQEKEIRGESERSRQLKDSVEELRKEVESVKRELNKDWIKIAELE